mgnify:CR=1
MSNVHGIVPIFIPTRSLNDPDDNDIGSRGGRRTRGDGFDDRRTGDIEAGVEVEISSSHPKMLRRRRFCISSSQNDRVTPAVCW